MVKQEERWPDYFDVVILPPPHGRDYAIALSKKLARYRGKFVLGKRSFIPHISLYHIPVRPQNFEDFSHTVEQIASRHGAAELRLKSIDLPLLMTDKPSWLKQIHLEVVKRTLPYFDWDYGAENKWSIEYVPARLKARAKEYLERFGSPMIDAVFLPHITLTVFENKSLAKTVPIPQLEPTSFDVGEIAICELGPSHSCQRTIAKFPLSK